MTVRERVVPPEGSVVVLRAVVAAGAPDALGSPDGLLSRVQQAIQHLADRAVFAVERIGVHGRFFLWRLSGARNSGFAVAFSHTWKGSLESRLVNSGRPLSGTRAQSWHTFHLTGIAPELSPGSETEIDDRSRRSRLEMRSSSKSSLSHALQVNAWALSAGDTLYSSAAYSAAFGRARLTDSNRPGGLCESFE